MGHEKNVHFDEASSVVSDGGHQALALEYAQSRLNRVFVALKNRLVVLALDLKQYSCDIEP